MNDVEFANLHLVHLLWGVAALTLVGVYGIAQQRRALRRFADGRLLPHLAPPISWARGLLRLAVVALALTALVIALVDPRWGQVERTVLRRNVDVLVLLDVSRSMLAQDIAPSRLERAKLALRDDLIPALGGDRIGLIAFAGLPSLACPLTSDYGFFRLALDDVSPLSSPQGGTLIGDAIRRAGEAFDTPLDAHKLVILITDGEDHESFPVQAARKLWDEQRAPVVAVALGDPREGARIPLASDRGVEFLQHEGATVWSKADFGSLRTLVDASPLGVFVPAGTQNFDLGEIYERMVAKLEIDAQAESQQVERPSRFYPFVVIAFVLLVADSVWPPLRRRQVANSLAMSEAA